MKKARRGLALAATGALAAMVGVPGLAQAGVAQSSRPEATEVPLVFYSAQGYDEVEASKNNPQWGLIWVDGATAMAGPDAQHLLLTGFEPNARNALGKQAVPADESYVPTGVTLTGAMAYNSAVAKAPPATPSRPTQRRRRRGGNFRRASGRASRDASTVCS